MRHLVEVGMKSGSKIRVVCKDFSATLNDLNQKYEFTGLRKHRAFVLRVDEIEYVRQVRRCL